MTINFSPEQLSEVLSLVLDVRGEHVVGSPTPGSCYEEAEGILRYLGLSDRFKLRFDDDLDVYFEPIAQRISP
jgi:hypothetical protein